MVVVNGGEFTLVQSPKYHQLNKQRVPWIRGLRPVDHCAPIKVKPPNGVEDVDRTCRKNDWWTFRPWWMILLMAEIPRPTTGWMWIKPVVKKWDFCYLHLNWFSRRISAINSISPLGREDRISTPLLTTNDAICRRYLGTHWYFFSPSGRCFLNFQKLTVRTWK